MIQSTPKRVLGKGMLRSGWTTGTCAAAAVTAACECLLGHNTIDSVQIRLPGGGSCKLAVDHTWQAEDGVISGVVKDAGDDPDVTHGLTIKAKVSLIEAGITLQAGEGIGVVTRPGLACQVGEPAINPVPRQMILEQARIASEKYHYTGGLSITISAPGGEAIALKTFNPRLGISGGLSILGTTGIVEPMSEKALIDTIFVLVNQASVNDSETVLLTPGNYGREFCMNRLGIDVDTGVKIGNFVGETLDYLVEKRFREVLLVGHVGKLVKIAGGIMNTHSKVADARMEILAAYAAAAGADQLMVQSVLNSATTREAIDHLREKKLDSCVLQTIAEKAKMHCELRSHQVLKAEIVLFSAENHIMVQTAGAGRLVSRLAQTEPVDLI